MTSPIMPGEAPFTQLAIQAAEVEYRLGEAESHNYRLAEAISSAIRDLEGLPEVPLCDIEESIQTLIAALREVL